MQVDAFGRREDLAIVLGGAECLWEDVAALEEMIGQEWPGLVVATNDAGVHWSRRLDHWVTCHPEKFHLVVRPGTTGRWEEERLALGHPGGYVRWARRNPELVDRIVEWNGGASGLMAAIVATRELGCFTVLCGVPMNRSRHFHDGRDGEPWKDVDFHWPVWLRFRHLLERVRSMSGETRKLLGAPTLDDLGFSGLNGGT